MREASKRGVPIIAINPMRERGLERFTAPQHPIEMAVHPEQVITLPATVDASTTDTGEDGSGGLDLGDGDQHPFERL